MVFVVYGYGVSAPQGRPCFCCPSESRAHLLWYLRGHTLGVRPVSLSFVLYRRLGLMPAFDGFGFLVDLSPLVRFLLELKQCFVGLLQKVHTFFIVPFARYSVIVHLTRFGTRKARAFLLVIQGYNSFLNSGLFFNPKNALDLHFLFIFIGQWGRKL